MGWIIETYGLETELGNHQHNDHSQNDKPRCEVEKQRAGRLELGGSQNRKDKGNSAEEQVTRQMGRSKGGQNPRCKSGCFPSLLIMKQTC